MIGPVSIDEEASIVSIVKYDDPLSLSFVAQPVVNNLEYVGLWVMPPKNLDAVCNVPEALLEPGRVARVDPEHPRLRRSLSSSIGIFNGKLRLSV